MGSMPRPLPKSIPLRIAVVQYNPKIGQVQANIARARELCRKLTPRSVDLVCFPEMAFTGYVFENSAAVKPYLEKPRIGPTSVFCSQLAKDLGCFVVAGYPEVLDEREDEDDTKPTRTSSSSIPSMDVPYSEGNLKYGSIIQQVRDKRLKADDASIFGHTPASKQLELSCVGRTGGIDGFDDSVGANCACLYGPDGERVEGYRKTNLFETDTSWAKPGTGFLNLSLPSPLRNLTLGICMDLNPSPEATWTLEEGPYEIADDCVKHRTNLLVLLNAWLDSGAEKEEQHDWQTLNYWAARLRPLWVNKNASAGSNEDEDAERSQEQEEDDGENAGGDETIVVVCNRTGHENGKTFAGTSALYSMRSGLGRPKLLDMMGREEEGVRVWKLLI